jgi:hypothetical protein
MSEMAPLTSRRQPTSGLAAAAGWAVFGAGRRSPILVGFCSVGIWAVAACGPIDPQGLPVPGREEAGESGPAKMRPPAGSRLDAGGARNEGAMGDADPGSAGNAKTVPGDGGPTSDAAGSSGGEATDGAGSTSGGAADSGSQAGPGVPETAPGGPGLPRTIPVLWIDVGKSIPDEPKVKGKLRVIEEHEGNPTANAASFATRPATLESAIGIELRGQTSQDFPKKPYGIELRDGAGMARKMPLLGMPPESDWVLYAPCYFDKSCLRNAFIYHLYRELDPDRYGVRWRFAEVFIDRDYKGLYLVVERIKRDRYRVNIPAPARDAASGDISGGYIFRRERNRGSARTFITPGKVWPQPATGGSVYIYHYPRHDRITSAQKAYLIDYVTRFEAVFNSSSWADPKKGYRSWIDLKSWLDTAIAMELSMDSDGYRKSLYFYKDADRNGGKLFSSPVWDFDLALGNNEFREPKGWLYKELCCLGRNPPPQGPNNAHLFYWHKIWGYYRPGDPSFHSDLKCRWLELRKGPLKVEHVHALIDGWVKVIAPAQKRDNQRWKYIGKVTGFDVPALPSFEAEVAFFKNWLAGRIGWLDKNLPGTCPAK